MMLHLMAKLFTSKTKRKPRKRMTTRVPPPPHAMVAVNVNYASYVLPAHEALQLIDLLAKAEIYESVFNPDIQGRHDDKYTHHVYAQDKQPASMKMLPDAFYAISKLAGRPEKK